MSIVPYTGGKGDAEKVILALVERYGPKVLAYAENKITKWYQDRERRQLHQFLMFGQLYEVSCTDKSRICI